MSVLRNIAQRIDVCGTCSDVGRLRSRNEDALYASPEKNFAVLADGMGGYHGGDIAAGAAVSAATMVLSGDKSEAAQQDSAVMARLLLNAVLAANSAILHEGQKDPSLRGMGSTIVMAALAQNSIVCAHVGDSRLYRLRGTELVLLTRDHTMLQEQVDAGLLTEEEARRSEYRGLLTRGLGIENAVLPDIGIYASLPGDLYLLCSDGLTDMVKEEDIAWILSQADTVQHMAEALVGAANNQGGHDNVSVVLLSLQV